MPDLTPYVVTGVALGGVYAMSGVGMVVLYRATGVLNLAYGAVGALGALVTWTLVNQTGCPDWAAYVICVLFGGVVSLLYGVLLGPPLAGRDPLVKAMGTLGLALLFLAVMSWVWSDDARSLVLPTTSFSYDLGDVRANWTQFISVLLAILVTVGTIVFLRVTKLGTAMRSLANDREITAMLGVPVRRVEAAAWLGSGLLCGATGLLLANLVGLDAVALTFLVISALGAALVGRLRSLWVTLLAGFVIGVVEACLTAFSSVAPYRTMTPFVFAIVALLWLGRHRAVVLQRGSALATTFIPGRLTPTGAALSAGRLDRRLAVRAAVITALLAFVLLGIPAATNTFWVQVCTAVAIYSVVALSASFLYGRVGLISLCQIALLAVGGWVALRLAYAAPSLPFPLLLLATGAITAVIGALIGLPALRLSGLYLALITLMAAGAVSVVLRAISFPNGGGGFLGVVGSATAPERMRRPEIALGDTAYYRYSVIVAALVFLLALWQISGKPGRAWAAIRQSEPSALAAGVNMTVYKVGAFALASFMTGVAGCLLAASAGGLSTFQFPTSASIQLLAAVLIGGIFSLWGAIIAALFMKLAPALLADWGLPADLLIVLFGVGLVQVLLTAPGGLADQFPKDMARLGQRLRRLVRRPTDSRGEAPA